MIAYSGVAVSLLLKEWLNDVEKGNWCAVFFRIVQTRKNLILKNVPTFILIYGFLFDFFQFIFTLGEIQTFYRFTKRFIFFIINKRLLF